MEVARDPPRATLLQFPEPECGVAEDHKHLLPTHVYLQPMSIAIGMRLGPHEILAPIGAGGMGEVYKARDTRLDRIVAIKVLHSELAAHSELRERLEREARAISSLSHPHICALYDVGNQAGIDYLVMEYLEGETLASRLKKGALPMDTALRYAIEIAQALDQAHRHGVVHRDLKPGNIMLTKSGTKLLDFGLAKIREPSKIGADGATALLTRNLTSQGTILGTFQYMAPEQLEGKEADARSDIFAFGAVLYEMLTSRKAFSGSSQASLSAAILTTGPPPMSSIQSLTPLALDRVAETCLAKDPDERWQSAGDLARELKWIADPAFQAESQKLRAPGTKSRSARMTWIVAAAAVVTALFVSWIYFREPVPERRSIRFTIATEARLPSQVRISPDGSRLAFVGQNAQGKIVLWVRQLDGPNSQPLPGTEGAMYPFWSHDSRQIGFYDLLQGKLKRIDSSGGPPQILGDVTLGLGGDWDADGTILFAPGGTNPGIYRVAANGGVPVQVTTPAPSTGHSFPRFLPDGRHFLYLALPEDLSAVGDEPSIRVASLDSKDTRPLLATPYSAYLSASSNSSGKIPPYLLFVRDGALVAQEMDLRNFQLRGEPIRISDSIATDGFVGFGDFSVSKDGTLAFNSAIYQHELIWLDRAGNRIGSGIPVDRYAHPTLTPDVKQAVFDRVDPKTRHRALWKLDVDRGEVSLFDFGDGFLPVFFPDGRDVGFTCMIDGKRQFCRKALGGAGGKETLWESGNSNLLVDFSPDGRFLSYLHVGKRFELWILPLTGDRRPYRFYPSESIQFHGLFSPDGKWIAYTSNETGDFEVYVQPFPATGEKWKVSAQGGGQPRWRRDGKEMFYRTGDGKMMVVSLRIAAGFATGVPRMLFQSSADPLFPNFGIPYTVAADGQRFLVNAAIDESRAPPITIITNWTAGLKR